MANVLRCSRSYQRLALRCLLAFALIAAILCFGSTWPPAANAEQPQQIRVPRRGLEKQQESLAVDQYADEPNHVQDTALPQRVNTPKSSAQTPAANTPPATSDKDWDATAHHIESLLEDEYRVKALLAPFTETGERMLRDLTHRVRAFADIWKTWEDLHFVADKDGLRQQSVISRLRARNLPSQSISQAIGNYDKARYFVNSFAKRLFPWTMLSYPDHMALHASFYTGGRGLVFTAGNDQAVLLLTVIPSLRQLGCDLPIEVMYLGDEDLDEDMRDELQKHEGVITRDLSLMIDDDGWELKGWAAKPFAILMSSFREAIFIDADSFFFVDPTTLFEDEAYRKTGALFFKDRNLSPENKRAWIKSILPSPISANIKKNRMWTGESGHMQESGVIVVDKYRHFIPLLLTTKLNGPDRDGNAEAGKRGVYEMMYGDKETFWLSWEMAGDLDYSFHDGVAGTMGKLTTVPPTDFDKKDEEEPTPVDGPMICSPQLIHFDRSGKPIWFNGWISESKDDLYQLQEFDSYLEEHKEVGRKPSKDKWQIHPGNVVCLEAPEAKKFTARDQETLDGILSLAKKSRSFVEDS